MTSIIPLLVYPLALLLKAGEEKFGRRCLFVFGWAALFPVLSMLCFNGNVSNLALQPVTQYFGVAMAGNNTFQMEVWETLLFTPYHSLGVLLRGGPFYLVHLIATAAGASGSLPQKIFVDYPDFRFMVLVRTAIIYAWPFALMVLFEHMERSRGKGRRHDLEE